LNPSWEDIPTKFWEKAPQLGVLQRMVFRLYRCKSARLRSVTNNDTPLENCLQQMRLERRGCIVPEVLCARMDSSVGTKGTNNHHTTKIASSSLSSSTTDATKPSLQTFLKENRNNENVTDGSETLSNLRDHFERTSSTYHRASILSGSNFKTNKNTQAYSSSMEKDKTHVMTTTSSKAHTHLITLYGEEDELVHEELIELCLLERFRSHVSLHDIPLLPDNSIFVYLHDDEDAYLSKDLMYAINFVCVVIHKGDK
jgi:hypothetical protein